MQSSHLVQKKRIKNFGVLHVTGGISMDSPEELVWVILSLKTLTADL